MEPLPLFFLEVSQPTKEALDKRDIKNVEQLEAAIARKELAEPDCQLVEAPYEEYQRLREETRNRIHSRKPVEAEVRYLPASMRVLDSIIVDEVPALTEIYGQKASGKSAVLVELISIFQRSHPDKSVLLLNCASGITASRYNRIRGNLLYRDVFSLNDAMSALEELEDCSNLTAIGMIAIDQPIKFAKVKQKPETEFLGMVQKLRRICQLRKLRIVLTNSSLNEKLRLYNDEASFNEASEYSASTSPFIDNRLSVHRMPDNTHLLVLLKSRFRWTFTKAQQFGITAKGLHYFDPRLNN